jgi:S1-C subfamily serine protease
VYDAKGHFFTNHHLLVDSKDIRVTLLDKTESRASVVGSDPATDIAVLKLDRVPDKLPVIVQGDSDKVRSGEMVIAVGSALGIPHTVAIGVVSGLTRQHPGLAEYEYFIQTDAPIHSGNSGGALVNIRGELVGINTAVVSPGAAFRGAGLCRSQEHGARKSPMS